MFRRISILGAAMLALAGLGIAAADAPDAWVSTKAKIVLLTSAKVSGANVDTENGTVTLHGKVETEAAKEKAGSDVGKLDGVKNVRNLLQVVPESAEKRVEQADDAIEDKVEAALKSDPSLEGVKVASVNKGVVLLSGKADVHGELRAIETAWDVKGVKEVHSEIQGSEHHKEKQ
jgi:hyperosmotically inducible periplasmic protein